MSNFDPNAYARPGTVGTRAGTVEYDQGLRAYMLGIYNNMTLALGISALVAWGTFAMATVTTETGRIGLTAFGQLIYTSPLKWVIMLSPLAFVFVLSFRFDRMSEGALRTTFLAFAAVMGLSLSSIFVIFKLGSIVQVLFMTAAAFGALSLYGYTTRRSLSGMGSFLMMGLFGIIIAGLFNLWFQSGALQFALNVIGILVFAGLTAWDTQRLKEEYDVVAGDSTMMSKASTMGALSLYLNFINMFQMLLSLFGQRND
jgi:uncharacterized protein